ncbi:hypothetical protein RB653_003913 [Dictyostelium firmibasis]|uniref:Monalysin Pore-forming domain-containing protein n=1 Tax=Dictyostelium firmibasis TaxID=79012 RepID=A0AAN7U9Q4_9MYCE
MTTVNPQITDAVDGAVNSQITDLVWNIPTSSYVKTNFQIDKHLKLQDNPDSMVFIETGSDCVNEIFKVGSLKLPVQVKPVACYRKFISSQTVVGTQQYEFSKKTGFSSTFSTSTSVKASVSSSIGVCDASFEVETSFSYSSTSYSETTETFTETLTSGDYTVYQNILLYAFKVDAAADPQILSTIKKDSPNIEIHQRNSTKEFYFFVPAYMNSPFTIEFSNDTYNPINEDDLISYLMNDGYGKWASFSYN